jgi:hypothetical protein
MSRMAATAMARHLLAVLSPAMEWNYASFHSGAAARRFGDGLAHLCRRCVKVFWREAEKKKNTGASGCGPGNPISFSHPLKCEVTVAR